MHAAWVLWKRQMRKFFRGHMEMVAALLFPLTIMLFFGVMMRRFLAGTDLLGGADYLGYITPGIVALTGVTASMLAGTSVLNDRIRGVMQEYLVAPIPRASITAAVMAAGVTRAVIQAVVLVAVALLLGASIQSFGGLLVGTAAYILFCAGFTGFAVAGAARANSMEAYHGIMLLLNVPLLFLSNALYPMDAMPTVLRVVAWLNPATYAVSAMRHAFPPASPWHPFVDGAVLAAFALVGLWTGVRALREVTDL